MCDLKKYFDIQGIIRTLLTFIESESYSYMHGKSEANFSRRLALLGIQTESEAETARLAPASTFVVLFLLLGFYIDCMKMDIVSSVLPTVQK